MHASTIIFIVAILALLIFSTIYIPTKLKQISSWMDDIYKHTAECSAIANTNRIFTERKIEQFDQDITSHKVEYYDQIEAILDLFETIIRDIKRLDAEQQRDRRDLADIRRRYILYKEPVREADDAGNPD